ncbi:MAG: signal peptidase II [Polyangiaceae bacterium]
MTEADQAEDAPSSEPISKGEPATVEVRQPPSYKLFAVIAALAAVADLASKEWATHALARSELSRAAQRQITVIPNFFTLEYQQNPGGAWSMLRQQPEIWRRPFFLFVSTVASVFITSLYQRVDNRDWAMKYGLPLALGGAIGNLVDRARRGSVVDFLHVFAKYGGRDHHWPTFNVADVWIVVGVILMGSSVLLRRSFASASTED